MEKLGDLDRRLGGPDSVLANRSWAKRSHGFKVSSRFVSEDAIEGFAFNFSIFFNRVFIHISSALAGSHDNIRRLYYFSIIIIISRETHDKSTSRSNESLINDILQLNLIICFRTNY